MNIPIAESDWTDAGHIFAKRGSTYRFMLPNRSDVVEAASSGGNLVVFPERSSAHKALVSALGLNV